MKIKSISKPIWIFTIVVIVIGLGSLLTRFFWPRIQAENSRAAAPSPLFDPGDKPLKIFIRAVDIENNQIVNLGVTIRESKNRANQMKQAVMAYLSGPRTGNRQVPVPEGLSLNEFYFTPSGAAVVDLSIGNVNKEKVGFYEEAFFIRGLIETLTSNFFEVKQVKVLVEGQDQSTILGHYALGTSEASMPVSASSNGPVN